MVGHFAEALDRGFLKNELHCTCFFCYLEGDLWVWAQDVRTLSNRMPLLNHVTHVLRVYGIDEDAEFFEVGGDGKGGEDLLVIFSRLLLGFVLLDGCQVEELVGVD